MNTIEKLLPSAIEAVKDNVLVSDGGTNKVPKEFNGYISSFGASVITSGLFPSIVFFSQEGKGRGNRTSVIKAIEQIIRKNFPELISENETLVKTIETLVKKNLDLQNLQDRIQDAAIALKLAIRIFPKSDKK